MNNLKLYTSNRLEVLGEKLAEVLSTPLASPLESEIIVVQSKGMERWVSMELAQRFGICANIRFPFPNAFVSETMQKIIPDIPELSPFDLEIMTWKIMNLLPTCIKWQSFESIRNYLTGTEWDLKHYQLAERIADTFDQYLLYRPEMILRWEQGNENHWQAVLWRELAKENGNQHRAALGKAFFELLERNKGHFEGFPQRVSVFGISSLPRFHIQIFHAIAHFTQVNLFLMNPCREYWGDILSDREMKRVAGKIGHRNHSAEALHLEKGNSLLASMGTLGRDFFDLIGEVEPDEFDIYEQPGEISLLSCIQSDILNLIDREKVEQKGAIGKDDLSIQIHSCHSPMREIEVLHDQLLKVFGQNPDLKPKDIIVMTPDIEIYAPYIQAVFDLPDHDPRKIPFTITDRSFRTESQVIETFMAILNLSGSRFGASQVLGILESQAVQKKFDLSEPDLELIRQWVQETRIRWGIDGKHRHEIGLPNLSENTWQAGLDRLLLGYALPGQNEHLFSDILPYDHIEGSDAEVLGNFIEFMGRLFGLVKSLTQKRTLNNWSETLNGILDKFFVVEEDSANEIKVIRNTLNQLCDLKNWSNFNEKVDINVITCYLEHYLEKEGFGYGFLTGGITFCAMLPMRSIPAKVICLVGMNSDAYPRQSNPLGFDLIAKYPKPGDRSRRNDDRYLFLESIISARDKLYISYVGQSIQDNSTIPPSVLVSELLDYIEQGFEIPGTDIRNYLITKHRLQGFSPEYFKRDNKLFSYSSENFEATKQLLKPREIPLPFISQGLTQPEDEWKTITLPDFCSFFANPAKFLLIKRLGIYLDERISILEENESFEMSGLDRYFLEQSLVEKKTDGRDLKQFFSATKASGQLPHGVVGDCIYDNLSSGVESFVEKTKSYISGVMLEALEVDLNISDFHLIGRIGSIYPERLIQFRYARVKARDRLKLWIYHLLLNSIQVNDYPTNSMLVALDPVWAAWEFFTVKNSEEILAELLQIYWQGLVKPLHFFPESSWEYAQRVLEKNKSSEEALRSANNKWLGSEFSWGECTDLYYQQCFGKTDPIDFSFQDLAIKIFKPLLENQGKVSS